MAPIKGNKQVHFPKVKEAREALAAKALDILEEYVKVVKAAAAAGNYEVATKSLQWLMEHLPETDGYRMLEGSVDKQETKAAIGPPAINIGFALGGIPSTQAYLADAPVKVLDMGDPREDE